MKMRYSKDTINLFVTTLIVILTLILLIIINTLQTKRIEGKSAYKEITTTTTSTTKIETTTTTTETTTTTTTSTTSTTETTTTKKSTTTTKPIDYSQSIEKVVSGKENELSNYILKLKGYDGSTQITHPKVIYFKNRWNGYNYWVAYTPYPKGDSDKENPFVMASTDLISWKAPGGNVSLDEPSEKTSKIYNSDTHLVYNYKKDQLEVYWRYVNDITGEVIIYKRTTKDGKKWTEKEEILNQIRNKQDYLSPAIIYENGIYKWWFVDNNWNVKYMEYNESNNQWSTPIKLDIKFDNTSLHAWHLDVTHTEKGYEMILVAFDNFKTGRKVMDLYYTNSLNNSSWTTCKKIASHPKGGGIYRSSILYIKNTYYILYSNIDSKDNRSVRILYGNSIDKLYGLDKNNVTLFKNYVEFNT